MQAAEHIQSLLLMRLPPKREFHRTVLPFPSQHHVTNVKPKLSYLHNMKPKAATLQEL